MDKRALTVRRVILETLKYYKSAPARPEDILNCHFAQAEAVQVQEVVDQANSLVTLGYAENLRPGRGILVRITAAGLNQIERNAKLDEAIWGDLAQ